ncbi:peptidylprolyl isomerase [Candidatus Woesearchaeota archaeon]|nr:peptidylprolyl isomerase [Candidatus Woesearchaeota archaeon]
MTDTIQEHDFVEIDYTGELPDGFVFDTTKKDVAEKHNLHTQEHKYGPIVVCIGEGHVLLGLEESLKGKESGKTYTFKLSPEKAFGKRDVKKVKVMPLDAFRKHKMNPYPGLQFDADGEMGTVMSVSGGRVIVNFNHPLAGKEVVYQVEIKRKVTDVQEQLKTFIKNSFHLPEEQTKIEVKEKNAEISLPFELPAPIVDLFAKKLNEITGLTVTIKKLEKAATKAMPS